MMIRSRPRQSGVALLEALIATVILAIGLLGAVGLQARAYSALADADVRAEATIATDKLLGVMANDAANLSNYALTSTGTPSPTLKPWIDETNSYIPGASTTITLTPQGGYTKVSVVIQWIRKAGPRSITNQHQITAYL
ncbi:prepilin-type N-terminal cleavage/methylation domain-containing protein [Rugamonas sp.]|uniref:type IV pilus modification PilV family protein n=1 Tax=Rugamonas sp. TaxID=1926287 RepID=UPI0025E89159|nr:prepilin-type N-terminal cleavage/methylation domain-containing protein [Rugamonas sp.]